MGNVTVIDSPTHVGKTTNGPTSNAMSSNSNNVAATSISSINNDGGFASNNSPIRSELLNFNVTEIKQPKIKMASTSNNVGQQQHSHGQQEQLRDHNNCNFLNTAGSDRMTSSEQPLSATNKCYTEHYID